MLANGYVQADLVSSQAGTALIHDPNLVNPWGLALSPTGGDFWVSDNGTSVATLYGGDVGGSALTKNSLVVAIPGGFPTADVFNAGNNFVITAPDGSSGPATFIFATQTGEIAGWNPSVPALSNQAQVAVRVQGADFTGLALNQNASGSNLLYAADFQNGKIEVFGGTFAAVPIFAGAFTDPNLPAGYAPFNIQDIGSKVFVTYAQQQNGGGGVFVPAKTGGIVDVYDASGNLVQRFSSDAHLNAPWGLAQAPANFGPFSGDILIGNFGDGRVNAFKSDGTFDGQLTDTSGTPISISGLRGLSFGNGVSAGNANTLFFTAEPGGANLPPAKTSLLLLDPSNPGALSAVGNGTVNVTGGGEVVVDSNDPAAIVAIGNAQMAAAEFDVTGVPGVAITGNATVSGVIHSGVAPQADPLASMPAPAVPTQTFDGVHATGQDNVTLLPGDYTGGIDVTGQATVTLLPGLYYVQGGISVTGQGQIVGQGVTIYLASSQSGEDDNDDDDNQGNNNNQGDNNAQGNGNGHGNGNGNGNGNGKDHGNNDQGDDAQAGGSIEMHGQGSIVISAPTSGPFEGIAIFEARDNGAPIVNDGNGSLSLTGTLYAPSDGILLSGNGHLSVRDDLSHGISAQVIASDLLVNGNGAFDLSSAPTTAGGANGLFGSLDAAGTTALVVTTTNLTATEGAQFSGAVAAFTSTTPGAVATDFTATIDWGDGTSTSATVTATGNGGFLVNGSHTYAEEGTETVKLTISDHSSNTASATETATVDDAPLVASGTLIAATSGQGGNLVLNGQVVATFVDTGGAEPTADYTATINWGDGSATSLGTVSLAGGGALFNVTGSHTYSQHGRFLVTVTIVDEGGATASATSTVVNGHTATDDDDAFIKAIFLDLLGRDVDDASLIILVNAMQNGMTPAEVAIIITQSDEYLEDVIRQAYRSFLGRDADDLGLQFWLAQMRRGLTDQDLDADFIGSEEFFEHAGGTDRAFVNELYFDLLGRAPDAGGLAVWLNALANGFSRTSAALGFAISPEHEGLTIDSDYETFLGRTPSPTEETGWLSGFQSGMTNEEVIAGFTGSSEFFQQQSSQD
ncbi:MAG TPA: TIGR03118 family protein [Pirellulales bacterium]|nr:TIGR03118 family protein [Pirellulales bacterium]